jgi:hypothetical protein
VRDEDVKRFNEFLSEFQNESDRGAALVGAAMIDTTLADTLASFMVRGRSRTSFSMEQLPRSNH